MDQLGKLKHAIREDLDEQTVIKIAKAQGVLGQPSKEDTVKALERSQREGESDRVKKAHELAQIPNQEAYNASLFERQTNAAEQSAQAADTSATSAKRANGIAFLSVIIAALSVLFSFNRCESSPTTPPAPSGDPADLDQPQ